MDIEVTILRDTDEDELYLDTKTLLQHFDLRKVKDMKDDGASKNDEEGIGKRKLSHHVRKGYEFRGVNITVSKKVSEDPGLSSAPFRSVLNQPLPAPPLGLPSETATPPSILSPRHNTQAPVKPSPVRPLQSRTQPPTPILPSVPIVPLRGKSLDDSEVNSTRSPRTKLRSSTIVVASCPEDDYENSDQMYTNSPSATASLPRPPRQSLPAPMPLSHKADSESGDSANFTKKINEDVEFLRRLVTVMQDNSLKDMTFLREEIKNLSMTVTTLANTVDTLSGQCRQLEHQVQELRNKPVPMSM